MEKCKTCEWWKETNRDDESDLYCIPEGFRECKNIKVNNVYNVRINGEWIQKEEPKLDDVFIDPDDPFCVPTICTGPEFGCIHHKEKS